MAQAVIGGLTVLVKLNPALVGSHMLISMALIAASTALVVREARPDTPPRWAVGGSTRALVVALVPLGALVLTLGTVVTGTGPHSGDQNAPYRYALNPMLVTRIHSGAVWLFLLVLLAVMLGLRRQARAAGADPVRRAAVERGLRRTYELLGLALAQGAVGYLQYATGLPGVLVGLHMFGASLMVVVQTTQVLALRPRVPEPEPAAPADVTATA
jgi:cytochrome c oxidase assembly protein subunit 15